MKKRILSALTIVAILAFGFALQVSAEEGVTDTEIHIASWGPQSGPAAAWGSVPRSIDAYFKMVNEEGGIHGRKIIYHHFDDGYNPARTKAGVKQLQESDHSIFAWVVGVGTAPGMAVMDYLMERKVPWIGPATGSNAWAYPPKQYLFAVYPPYYDEAIILSRYAVKDLGKKRVAIVYQNDEYGKSGLRGAEKALSGLGMSLVEAVSVNVTDNDMKPVIMNLKKADADVVLLWLMPSTVVRVIGTGAAMQYSPQWMSTSTCSDFALLYQVSRGVIKGLITGSFGLTAESQDPLLLKYKRDAFDKYAPKGERWGLFWYAGIGFMEPLPEALKRVGRDLTRERLVAELEKLQNFQGIFGKISYKPFKEDDPTTRQGQTSVFLVRCGENGVAESLTDWMTVD